MRFLLLLCLSYILEAANQYAIVAISPAVSVARGPVNGVLIRRNGKVLAIYGDPRGSVTKAEQVLFTHHRRDVAWAGRALVQSGAKAVVPAAESSLFAEAPQFWERYRTARFHDYSDQSSRILATPIVPARMVRGGDKVEWEGVTIRVLDTPGCTRGSVSYLFEADGKRIACVGDLIYGDGKIIDLFSLQDAIAETKEDGYHGWAARAADVIASLRKIAATKPDFLIPSRGPVIGRPQEAVDKLFARLRAVFMSHFEIDALRWYRGDDKIRAQAARVLGKEPITWMAMAEEMHDSPPEWIVPITNSRLILSAGGSAFLVDCGNQRVREEVRNLQKRGRFKTLDGIYVTHYHDDHTNMVQAMAEEFQCPVFVCPEMRDILEHPEAYRMPAETPNPIHRIEVMREGATRRWKEFELTYSYFPGQTIYHGGLLVRKDDGQRIFFIGDSFTPSGIDDYCLLNRNFQEPEQGFVYCLNALKQMKPDYLLINEHVLPPFRFSAAQIDFMLANLRKRRELLQDLFPWDDPNFGVDEQWARFYPYTLEAHPGQRFALRVVIRNHSPSRQEYRVTPQVPAGWKAPSGPLKVSLRPRAEGSVLIPITPATNANGLAIVTAGVAYGGWEFREWTEAMVTVRGTR